MTTNDAAGLRVAIVDGDEGARRKLRALLESDDRLQSVHEAASPFEAARVVGEAKPDLVFLDIDMPGAAGLALLRAADAPCVVLVTSRPERALQGLEFGAVGCLLRPVSRDRLAECLARARRRLAERRIAALALEIAAAAAAIRGAAPVRGLASRYPDQMTIRVRRRMFALAVADIAWIEGASQYSRVHARTGEFLLSRSLSSLECELDPERFFRIHRSAIVNADHVREVMSRGDGRYNVYLHGGQALPLGRARRDALDRLLGGMGRGCKGDAPLWPAKRQVVDA